MIRLFFLMSCTFVFSQQIERNNRAVIHEDSLLIWSTDSLAVAPLSHPTELANKFSLKGINFEINRFQPVSTSKGLFFLDPLGGAVVEYKNDTLVRLDKSFKHRMQIDASVLVHHDTILKYGGYGFWSMRNYFTYYDHVTNEWEVYPPLNSSLFPPGTASGDYVKKDSEVIFYSGKQLDPVDLVKQTPNQEIWKFNFSERAWTKIGETHINFNRFKLSIPFEDKIAYFDEKEIYVVDPFNNEVIVYAQNSLHQNLINKSLLNTLYFNEVFYCFTYSNNTNEVNLMLRNKDEFFGSVLRRDHLYPTHSPYWYLLVLLLLIPAFIGFKYFKKRQSKMNRIQINGSGVIYKRIFYTLNEHELKILRLLIEEKNVETSAILNIIENPAHNYSHNMRTKNKIIGELQYKLQTILKTQEEVLSVQKSPTDKRIMIYSLNLNYFKN